MGSGGKADAGTVAFPGVGGPAGTLEEEEPSVGTRTFRTCFFSTALELPEGVSVFLAFGVTTAFTDFFVVTKGVFDLAFPLSNAGKSSLFKPGWVACDAIAFDRPELVARFFTSCLFWAVEVSPGVSRMVCGGMLTTFARGVAARGTKLALLAGWNGAVVGRIREAGFVVISSAVPTGG